MSNRNRFCLVIGAISISLVSAIFLHAQHPEKHIDEMNRRGDKHMGFDHRKTTHHFLLARDGGVIQVEANNAKDTNSRDQIRGHLRHIATMFTDGDFKVPMLIHEKTPPGSEVMTKLKSEIVYKFKETDRGALIQISTRNPEALEAIHSFLRFQIKEHMTGDPLEVKNE